MKLQLFSVLLLAASATSQIQNIKFLFPGQLITQNSIEDDNIAESGNRYSNVDRVCANGLWALYSQPNFGIDQKSFTSVGLVGGLDIKSCTPPNNGVFSSAIRSIRYLGNKDISVDQLNLFSTDSFLGADQGIEGINSSGAIIPNGFRLGSLAITGENNRVWQLCPTVNCNPVTQTVCIDMGHFGPLYALSSTRIEMIWPLIVRAVRTDVSEPKANCNRARTPTSSALGIDNSHFHTTIVTILNNWGSGKQTATT